jgi:hypothetical protein
MRRTTRLATLVTALGSVALTFSACGSGFAKQPVDDIVTAAQKATASISALHVKGRVARKGVSYLVDLHVSRSGACRGTIARKEGRMEVLVVEDRAFVRGDPERLLENDLVTPKEAKLLGHRRSPWLERDLAPFGSLCDVDELLGTVDAQEWIEEGADADVKVVGTREIAGERVVKLSSEQDGTTNRMFVTAGDPHHVLRLVSRGGADGPSRLTFSEYDIPVGTLLPAKADIVKLVPGRG